MTGRFFIGLTTVCMMLSSCNKDYFDKERYEELIATDFPVSDVDPTHNWNTLVECTANIGVDIAGGKTYMVKVYEDNPMIGYTGYVMVQGQVENGKSLVANFSHPQMANTFYVAVVDENGTVYSQPVTVKNGKVTAMITADNLAAMESTHKKVYDIGFDMAYCFEDCYPQSGDYDFNDVVIGTNMIKNVGVSQTTITFDVTLKAIGSTKMMAAALHVAGLGTADVESVRCEGDLFNYNPYGLGSMVGKDKKKLFPVKQPEEGYLQSTLQAGVYIPLTNDVHYAMNNGMITPTGMVERMNYNTMLPSQLMESVTGGMNANIAVAGRDIAPVKGTISITLKSGVGDKNITTKNIDMFIMEDYNGAIWEVHTFAYKTKPVVFAQGIYEENVFPWAVAVPGSGFRWPAEGKSLGAKDAGVFGGAYQTIGHSFGEWAQDKNRAKDWYKYPALVIVY